MARARSHRVMLLALAAFVAAGLVVIVAAQGPQAPPLAPGRPIAIVGGQLIDATGAPPRRNHTVVIQGERITEIGPSGSVKIPEGAEIINADGMTVMPGLISSNQHIQMNGLFPAPTANLPLAKVKERWERLWAGSERRAYVFLMQGHTSMRQTSGPPSLMVKIKGAIDAGQIPGPRIFLGGGLFRSEVEWRYYLRATPPEAHEWLRNNFAFIVIKDIERDTKPYEGPEFAYWKLRMGDVRFDGTNDFTDEEIRAFIAKAHRLGKKVDCHCGGTNQDMRRMMQFDIDTLEHPFSPRELVDQDIIDTWVKKGTIIATLLTNVLAQAEHANDPHRFDETRYIMSFDPRDYRILMHYRDGLAANARRPDEPMVPPYDATRPPDFPGLTLPRSSGDEAGPRGGRPSLAMMNKQSAIAKENMRRFIKAGAKFSMGTDTNAFFNFQDEDPSVKEMAYMVETGMTPMQAIEAATRNGAEALGVLKDLGTIEKGKRADIIVVAGNALENMSAMKRVAVVIKGGVRYK